MPALRWLPRTVFLPVHALWRNHAKTPLWRDKTFRLSAFCSRMPVTASARTYAHRARAALTFLLRVAFSGLCFYVAQTRCGNAHRFRAVPSGDIFFVSILRQINLPLPASTIPIRISLPCSSLPISPIYLLLRCFACFLTSHVAYILALRSALFVRYFFFELPDLPALLTAIVPPHVGMPCCSGWRGWVTGALGHGRSCLLCLP